MKLKALFIAGAVAPIALSAQVAPTPPAADDVLPSAFADLEMERSRACVGVLDQLADLNLTLQPMGLRTERLRAIANAIALEDREIIDQLDATDDLEAAVQAWFVSDGQLASAFADSQEASLQQQRRIAREGIKNRVQAAITSVQTEAQAILDGSGTLPEDAQQCDGAILIRSAVDEVCATATGPVCDAAASEEPQGIRFVDTAEDLWDVKELRPWTAPDRLQPGPNGGIIGGSTAAYARHGNIVLTVSFAPFIRERAALDPADVIAFEAILDSIGFEFEHPSLVYAPSLAIGATLPEPLAGEDLYVLHFGEGESLDVMWTSPAATGAPIEGPAILNPGQLVRLQSGEPILLTAVLTGEDGENEALYTLDLTTVNQTQATGGLLVYMAQQLAADLAQLLPGGTTGQR